MHCLLKVRPVVFSSFFDSLGLCWFRSAHRPAMNTLFISLDGFAETLNRDDMSWFYNEFSDVVLTRTSIRRSLNQRPRARSSAHERIESWLRAAWFRRKVRVVPSPHENWQTTSDVSFFTLNS